MNAGKAFSSSRFRDAVLASALSLCAPAAAREQLQMTRFYVPENLSARPANFERAYDS